MKRGGKTWTVDWRGNGEPAVGHVIHHITPTQQDGGWWRVTGFRKVKVRKPLPPPYTDRYRVTVEYIGERHSDRANWVMYSHARVRRPRDRFPMKGEDRFSPLLPPSKEN